MAAALTDEKKGKAESFMYLEKLPDDIEPMRQLLGTYSKIPPGEIDAHLYEIRAKAWAIRPYPCIGNFTFLHLGFAKTASYREAVQRLTDASRPDEALLDLGCCFGQVLRRLASDGVDARRLYGADLCRDFIDLGHELFRDAPGAPPYTFVVGDLLDENDGAYDVLKCPGGGTVSLIHAANFFHLFSRQEQVAAAVRMVGFLRTPAGEGSGERSGERPGEDPGPGPGPGPGPDTNGTLTIFGSHLASKKPGEQSIGIGSGRLRFLHNAASFQALWDDVGRQTGTRWRADVDVVHPGRPRAQLDPEGNIQYVRFAVYRL